MRYLSLLAASITSELAALAPVPLRPIRGAHGPAPKRDHKLTPTRPVPEQGPMTRQQLRAAARRAAEEGRAS